MADNSMTFSDTLMQPGGEDFLRELTEFMLNRIKALNAFIQEAWINGVSTRKVNALIQSMGMTGISRSQISSICRGIDERVQTFLHRPSPSLQEPLTS